MQMETRKELTRRSFLKLGLSGISAIALLFVIGCGGMTMMTTTMTMIDDNEGGRHCL
jgi:Fe2+ transport system protein B